MTGPADQTPPTSLDLESLHRIWPAVLDHLSQTAPALAAFFEEARPVSYNPEEKIVEISFPAGATFNKRKAEVPEQRERVAEALAAIAGEGLRPTYVLADGDAAPVPDAEAPASAAGDDDVDEEELLRRLKSEFDAEEVS